MFKIFSSEAVIPQKLRPNLFELFSSEYFTLAIGERKSVSTGIVVEVSENSYLEVVPTVEWEMYYGVFGSRKLLFKDCELTIEFSNQNFGASLSQLIRGKNSNESLLFKTNSLIIKPKQFIGYLKKHEN